jgi:two-component sensor histidine kinase
MLRVLFLSISFLISMCCFSQLSNYDVFYNKVGNRLLNHQYTQLLEEINLVLINNSNKYSPVQIESLKVFKVQALADAGLIDEGLELSNEILSQNLLSEYQLTRLVLVRALIFEILQDFPKSLQELNLAESYINKSQRVKNKYYATWLIRLSSWYRIQEKKEKSYQLAIEAKQFADKHNDYNNSSEAGVLQAFYNTYIKNYKKAEQLYNTGIALGKKLNNKISVTYLYLNLSKNYKELGKDSLSYKYIDSAYHHIKNTNYSEVKAASYLKKSEVFEAQKQIDSALYFYKEALKYEKQHDFNLKTIKINEQTLNFELKKEKIQKQKVIDENKVLNVNLLLILTLTIILLIFLLQSNKTKKQIVKQKLIIENDAVELEKTVAEKTFLIQELNHRVKNNLALILALIEFQADDLDDIKYQNKFKNLQNRIKTISIAHEQFTYDEKHMIGKSYNLKKYIEKISDGLKNIAVKSPIINLNVNEVIEVNIDTALPIGIILNELISNSIEHAEPKEQLIVDLQLLKNKNTITINYKDNGVIFHNLKKPSSLGTTIIQGMVEQLSGDFKQNEFNYFISIMIKK